MSQFTLKILRSKNIFLINTFVVMVRNSKPFQFDQILSNKISKMCSLKTSQIILSKFPTQKIRIDGFHNFKMDGFPARYSNYFNSSAEIFVCNCFPLSGLFCQIKHGWNVQIADPLYLNQIFGKLTISRKTIFGMKISYLQTLILCSQSVFTAKGLK